MTDRQALTERYWLACAVIRKQPCSQEMQDHEAWGCIADVRQERQFPKLADSADRFLFPNRPERAS